MENISNSYAATLSAGEGSVAITGEVRNSSIETHVTVVNISPSRRIAALLQKLRSEVDGNQFAIEMLAELQGYIAPKEKDKMTLEEKLTKGNMTDRIPFATTAKEAFWKKLNRFSLFNSAQKLYLHVLSKIYADFSTQIIPKIREGAKASDIENDIRIKIIEPLAAELEEEPLDHNRVEIYGMLYFLTGNCKIEWH